MHRVIVINRGTYRGSTARRFVVAALLSAGLAAVFAQSTGRAQSAATPADAFPYSGGGFLVTGDYVVAGIDLTPQLNPPDANGLSTGTITIPQSGTNSVPQDADVVAAYLYWEAIFTPTCLNPVGATGSSCLQWLNPADSTRFDGLSVSPTARKANSFMLGSLGGAPATCWGAAGTSMAVDTMFRADVMALLPKRLDANNQWTGKYNVNGSHTISLLETSGNHAVQSAGATLVIVYRDETKPLRKILLFDGVYPQADAAGVTFSQTLRGFYQSAAAKSAKLTHIVASGGNNQTEAVWFNGAQVSPTDPFPQTSPSSDRSWANPTYDVSALMQPITTTPAGFGETAQTSIVVGNSNPAACRASAAVIFSTAVEDTDNDGIPDGVENAPNGLLDPPTASFPGGVPLPNLNAWGAGSDKRDLFIEVNAMQAAKGTTYGSTTAPFSSTMTSVQDTVGHNHMPPPNVVKLVGDAYAAHQIRAHFDVGDLTTYYGLTSSDCPDPTTVECNASAYLIQPLPNAPTSDPSYPRGGELINEVACNEGDTTKLNCQFYAFPGTVGWKIGLQLYRDAPVGDSGQELSAAAIKNTWPSGLHRRRFDLARREFFHYVLYAHARGKPKSPFPCLDANGSPTSYVNGTCASPLTDNPAFHVPTSGSGIADEPGGNALVTLGLWDNVVFDTTLNTWVRQSPVSAFVRASTTFHEVGHNFDFSHGGIPPKWGNATATPPTATYLEPNCKPNYLSSMSYLFQVHGLFTADGNIHLDYSGLQNDDLNETSLTDGPLGASAPPYVPVWFAPAGSQLALNEGVSAATRFCNGPKFGATPPTPAMARVHAATSTSWIDWNGDLAQNSATNQNVNFDGTAAGAGIISSSTLVGGSPLLGYDDWSNIRLDQIGAGRHETKFSDGDFTHVGTGDYIDIGSGDFLDIATGDFIDLGSGDFLDLGTGDFIDLGSGDFLDIGTGDFIDIGTGDFMDIASGDYLDLGTGDFLDLGTGDFLDLATGSDTQELDFQKARGIGRPAPYGLTACTIGTAGCWSTGPGSVALRWTAPTFGNVGRYLIYRKRGDVSSPYTYTQVGTSTTTSFIDTQQLSNQLYTYYVKAEFNDVKPAETSPPSNTVTVNGK